MYWLRWHYHVKDIARAPYKIKKKRKTKRQNRQQSVVVGRQQLYCAVQSRSSIHCQMTTGKVQSLARNGTSSATVHSWQTTAGCSTHVPKPLERHGHWVLNVWWMTGGTVHMHNKHASLGMTHFSLSKLTEIKLCIIIKSTKNSLVALRPCNTPMSLEVSK